MTTSSAVAVALALVGGVLFGLAAVRQHHEVQATMTGRRGLRARAAELAQLVRQPAWLLGALQGAVAAGMHVVALALAPITLVQPIGVVAVPVTVVAAAMRQRRRPGPSQVVGSVLSVVGVAALTVLLITPEAHAVVLPSWPVLAATVAVLCAVGGALIVRPVGPPAVRCVLLAVVAAVLFGVNSILIRLIGQVVSTGSARLEWPLLVTAAIGLAVALPVGLAAMQTAYLSGSPHVVICTLTLVDPLSAVVGAHLLLADGLTVGTGTLVAALACALVATAGVVLLSRDYPAEMVSLPPPLEPVDQHVTP